LKQQSKWEYVSPYFIATAYVGVGEHHNDQFIDAIHLKEVEHLSPA